MLEHLFSSKVQFAVLDYLFSHENQSFSTSQIVEATEKQQPNVAKELDKLVDFGFVLKNKQGNQNFFSINNTNKQIHALRILFQSHHAEDEKYFLINEEGNTCLLTTKVILEGFEKKPTKDHFLSEPLMALVHFQNNYFHFYVHKAQWQRLLKEAQQVLSRTPEIIKELVQPPSESVAQEARVIFESMRKRDWGISAQEAKKIIARLYEITSLQSHLNMIGVFDLSGAFSDQIKDLLTEKAKKTNHTVAFLMERLLQPPKKSWTQQMREELIRGSLLGTSEVTEQGIDSMYQKWFWLNFGYRGPGLTKVFFQKTVEELQQISKTAREEELEQLEHYESRVQKEKHVFFKELKLNEQQSAFIEAVSLLSYLKVLRKDTSFLCFAMMLRFAERFILDIPKQLYLYATPEEFLVLFDPEHRIDKSELAKRQSEMLLSVGRTMTIQTDQQKIIERMNEVVEKEQASISRQQMSLLHGTTACLGKTGDWVYGKVRVINHAEEMKKMQQGDVLVSVATTPEILFAMKKASAIVTDMGGITCHAAIVSRELNIPCLIATRYATKLFKDGDEVIVCPRHAYIKFQD